MARTWLITGSSKGLGRALAEEVLARGENVVVTTRNVESLNPLVEEHPESALALSLDVTRTTQIGPVIAAAMERFGAIDVLVNNVGYGYRSALEEGEDGPVRKLFDTNVFGLIDVTKAVLPGMRARRSGVIVNISSLVGRWAPPGSGYYAATKFAIEGLSDALRKEVEPLGLRVLVVEPSSFRTGFAESSLVETAVTIDDYTATAGVRRKRYNTLDGNEPGDPMKAARAIADVIDNPNPPFRLLLGRQAVQQAEKVLDELRAELEAWRLVGEGADYDDPASVSP